MPDQLPKEVVQDRYERLLELVNGIAWEENKKLVGNDVEVLVATGEGRKDEANNRMSGRARDNRLVHFEIPDGAQAPRPGDMVTVTISRAAPYFLVADHVAGSKYELRRTRGGDAYDRSQLESCGVSAPGDSKVTLGLPIRAKREL